VGFGLVVLPSYRGRGFYESQWEGVSSPKNKKELEIVVVVKDSVSGLEVEMTVVATVKNGKILTSYLQSFSLPGTA